ncbi:hypothetical protein ACFUJU_13600 [Streptomyces sp. NPDC057235]|uniref:hypothetical protein n=1 Tax=Streptomyces sp. NPDC057235 TaxID=3346058 RepID=UPI00363A87A8
MTQPEPLDPDEQAHIDLHEARTWPLAEHGRSCARRDVPQLRPIHDVLEDL